MKEEENQIEQGLAYRMDTGRNKAQIFPTSQHIGRVQEDRQGLQSILTPKTFLPMEIVVIVQSLQDIFAVLDNRM